MNAGEISHKQAFRSDFIWYLMSSVIPMAIGFIRTPVFTRHFSGKDFGELGLVTITFSFMGMLLFSWISSCIWRFFNRFEKQGNLSALFSNLLFIFLCAFCLLGIFTMSWSMYTGQESIRELIVYAAIQLILNQLFLAGMVVVRLKKKPKLFMVLQGGRSAIGLLLALFMVFYMELGIVALVSSLVWVDALALLLLTFFNPAGISIDPGKIKLVLLKELLAYGSAGLVLNLSLLSISYMDRYIIAYFYDLEKVGIYDQVTKISQFSVLSLVMVYFNTINPALLKKLETNFEEALDMIRSFMFTFLLFGFPVVFYLTMFAQDLAGILLGEEFREGYILMPFFFWSALVYGISNFFELRLKFSNRIRQLVFIALIAALANLLMNVLLVGNFGYQWAAYTTLATYLLMLLMLLRRDSPMRGLFFEQRKTYAHILIFLLCQFLIYHVVLQKIELHILERLAIGLIFVVMYLLYFRRSISETVLPMN